MVGEFVVVHKEKFQKGMGLDSVLCLPTERKQAECEAAWLEHLMGWAAGTTCVVPANEPLEQ